MKLVSILFACLVLAFACACSSVPETDREMFATGRWMPANIDSPETIAELGGGLFPWRPAQSIAKDGYDILVYAEEIEREQTNDTLEIEGAENIAVYAKKGEGPYRLLFYSHELPPERSNRGGFSHASLDGGVLSLSFAHDPNKPWEEGEAPKPAIFIYLDRFEFGPAQNGELAESDLNMAGESRPGSIVNERPVNKFPDDIQAEGPSSQIRAKNDPNEEKLTICSIRADRIVAPEKHLNFRFRTPDMRVKNGIASSDGQAQNISMRAGLNEMALMKDGKVAVRIMRPMNKSWQILLKDICTRRVDEPGKPFKTIGVPGSAGCGERAAGTDQAGCMSVDE